MGSTLFSKRRSKIKPVPHQSVTVAVMFVHALPATDSYREDRCSISCEDG